MRAMSIPFDRTRSFMSFRFAGGNIFSNMLDLNLILELNDKSFEFKHSND